MKLVGGTLAVRACAPYPPTRHCRVDAAGKHQDQRLMWLPLSMKRGETWTDLGGVQRDPAEVIANALDESWLGQLSPPNGLVPVPRSECPGSSWPPKTDWPGLAIASAIRSRTGAKIFRALWRHATVEKSSTAEVAGRPRATIHDHLNSIEAIQVDLLPAVITLVDDTLTRGTQLAAAVECLRTAGYEGDIQALTAAHVLGGPHEPREWRVEISIEWDSASDYAARTIEEELPDWYFDL